MTISNQLNFSFKKHKFGYEYNNENFYVFFGNELSYENICTSEKLNFFYTKQVHGNKIFSLEKAHKFSICNEIKADAIYTKNKNVGLSIQTADCVPCFLIQDDTLISLHLGWRSVEKKLLEKALQKIDLNKKFYFFIGPHIQQKSFEVGEEVVSLFAEQHPEIKNWSTFINNRHHVCLTTILKIKLAPYIVQNTAHITELDLDTLTNPSFASHRRNATKKRNLSFAFLK